MRITNLLVQANYCICKLFFATKNAILLIVHAIVAFFRMNVSLYIFENCRLRYFHSNMLKALNFGNSVSQLALHSLNSSNDSLIIEYNYLCRVFKQENASLCVDLRANFEQQKLVNQKHHGSRYKPRSRFIIAE